MAVPADPAIDEEEQGGPTHHPSAPSHEFFYLSTTVDPSYIISLIRKLLPLDSASQSRSTFSEAALNGPNQGSLNNDTEDRAAPSASDSSDEKLKSQKNNSENMDVDVFSGEFSHPRGEDEGTGDGFEDSGVSVGEDAWEEYGCILWDLAASKTHAELMVENLILEVLLANLIVCKSERVTEISIGIVGNLACHEVPMKHIASTKGLIEIIVDKLFMDDPQCLCETCRLFTVGLQSSESITWAEALQSEHILRQILWIAENTLNLQLLEKSIGLILAILESQRKVVDVLLPPMMKLGFTNILISLLTFEISKLKNERIPERYSILDLILRALEAFSVMDDHSQEICSSKELFQLICDLVKFPDKVEVGNCCVTAAILIANMLSDVSDHASEISQDWSLLGGLLDIFPFASDDAEARNALWNVIARILVRIRETEMSPSSLYHYVLVLVGKIELIEDELLNQQVDSGHEPESLSSPGSTADARNTSLGRIISILNHWTAAKEKAENNVIAEVPVSETDVKRMLDCCHKFSK
ncbi:protein saal1 isoform X2 [Abrus precatorius]|uniref:Protein saal1 isoform X2 n=1 Tax=Abrus precatorius TaxID=3816 RepID=A0A8B8KF66_ABRPR|nr:protein saal1 isoform X2 [Abrus precatorius]